MIEEILYIFEMVFGAFLGLQCVSIFLFLFLEWAIVDYYEYGTFENPTNFFAKITNFFMNLFMGSGYFWYRKFSKQKWIIRKIKMFIVLIIQTIISVSIFYIITVLLDLIS